MSKWIKRPYTWSKHNIRNQFYSKVNNNEKRSEVTQSCPTLCDPMDGNLPGSVVHGIFQARILEWAAISFSRRSFQPRDRTQVSCIADSRFTVWATRETHIILGTDRCPEKGKMKVEHEEMLPPCAVFCNSNYKSGKSGTDWHFIFPRTWGWK